MTQKEFEREVDIFIDDFRCPSPTLLVHTSGSTGTPKPLVVEKERMKASAEITINFLRLSPADTALLCMPIDYIAGKMMVVRALTGGLSLLRVLPSLHPLQSLECSPTFAAMVPSQVYASMRVDREMELLKGIRHLIIGGGAISPELAAELRDFPNYVWSTYGMTETLSHIALRRLNGGSFSTWYTPFPSVKLSLTSDSRLVIDAPRVCSDTLVTNDIAELSSDGRFRIIGRKEGVVCSGGIKIQIEEVEFFFKPFLAFPFLITSVPDTQFSEVLAILCSREKQSISDTMDGEATEDSIKKTLAIATSNQRGKRKYYLPKYVFVVDTLPFTATGKPKRAEAKKIAAELHKNKSAHI